MSLAVPIVNSAPNGTPFDFDSIKNFAKVLAVIAILLVIGYFIVGYLGGTLVTLFPNAQPGTAQYNVTYGAVKGIQGVESLFSNSVNILGVVILIGLIAVVIVYLMTSIKTFE